MTLPADKNHFGLFGLPVGFEIDPGELSVRYRELQRRVHPDKFASGTDAERRASVQLATQVNDAFLTLKDPVRRAHYLLGLAGIETRNETGNALDPAFLMEQMELREALSQVRTLDDPHKKLAELSNDAAQRMQNKVDQFRDNYENDPVRALQALREMQFLDKLRREIDELEEELA